MTKKKDVVSKIKLTKREKKQYKAWMSKADEISMQIIQLQRVAFYFYSLLYALGSFIFPKAKTKWSKLKTIYKITILYLAFKLLNWITTVLYPSLEISSISNWSGFLF